MTNITTLNNCLFVYDQLCNNLKNAFSNYFKFLKDQTIHNMNDSLNPEYLDNGKMDN